MKYQQLDGDAEKKLYYLDDNPVDKYLAQTLTWHPSQGGEPLDDDTLDCVGKYKKFVKSLFTKKKSAKKSAICLP